MLKKVLDLCSECQSEALVLRETELHCAGYQLDRVDELTNKLIDIVKTIDRLNPGFDTIYPLPNTLDNTKNSQEKGLYPRE
jgi:hypothetical protein